MDLAGSAVGIASLGIQVCQSLITYYDGYMDYSHDIAVTLQTITQLNSLLVTVKGLLDSINEEKRKHVVKAMEACKEDIEKLKKRADKLRSHVKPKGLQQKIIAQSQRAIYPFKQSTLAKLRENVSDIRSHLNLCLDVLGLDITIQSQEKLENLAIQLQKTSNSVDKVRLQNKETRTLLISDSFKQAVNWLNAPDTEVNYNRALALREPGTGSWLVNGSTYSDWKNGLTRHLWLHGKAGSGKSVISATIVEDIRRHCQDRTDIGWAMFYFAFDDTSKQSYHSCLRSIISQVCKEEPRLTTLLQAYKSSQRSSLADSDLEELFNSVIQSYPRFILILDALDECPESSSGNHTYRQVLLNNLNEISQKAQHLKILATSRHLDDIEIQMTKLGALEKSMSAGIVNEDIKRYVASQLAQDSRLCSLSPALKQKIEVSFMEKADGMFRWANLQMEELKNIQSTRPSYITRVLNSLPVSLYETYLRMLGRIQKELHDDALIFLRWITYSLRPLTLGELAETVIIDPSSSEGSVDFDDRGKPEDVLRMFAGLIIFIDDDNTEEASSSTESTLASAKSLINDLAALSMEQRTPEEFNKDLSTDLHTMSGQNTMSNRKIKLAHFSVKEYLESSEILESSARNFHLSSSIANQFLADCCLVYLVHYSSNGTATRSEKDISAFPLLEYSASEWYNHFWNSTSNIQKALLLLQSQTAVDCWITVHNPERSWTDPFQTEAGFSASTGVYYASFIGLDIVLKELIKYGSDIKAQGGLYGNPLQAASYTGHEEVIKILIDHGADVNAQGGIYDNALTTACKSGDKEIVKILVDHGADINAQDSLFGNALSAAFCYGNEEIVKILIDHGADVTQSGDYGNALTTASYFGSEEVVKILIDRGVDVNAQSGDYGNALTAASYFGSEEVVKILIDHGADVNAQSGRYGNALNVATCRNEKDIFKMLLEAGARSLITAGKCDVHARYKRDKTTLDYVCIYGSVEMLETYLAKERHDSSIRDSSSSSVWSPIHWACRSGSFKVLELLNNADFQTWVVETSQPAAKWTPLDIAVYYNNRDLVAIEGNFVEDHNWNSICRSGVVIYEQGEILLHRENSFKSASKNEGVYCDGCSQGIYGLRFKCQVCEDFDYCFMCKLGSEALHPDHRWECFDPDATSDDSEEKESNSDAGNGIEEAEN